MVLSIDGQEISQESHFILITDYLMYRAWQINGINDMNEINDGLINLCKLGPGLMTD